MKHVDAAVIGFGTAGKALALALANSGVQVCVIEQSEERYEAAIDEKDRLVRSLRVNNYHSLANHPRISVVDGTASFVAPHTLRIESRTEPEELEAEEVFICTGSRPIVPAIPGAEGPRVYTSETMMDVRVLPQRLVIIGAGYIGMEFASMYANVTAIENDVEQALVVLERGGETLRVPADAVLMAVGRRPNLEGLNVEASGVDLTDHGGVITDDHLRSTVPNVWALGDVRGKHQFTYIAYDDYRIVASDLLGDGTRTTSSRGAIPYAVFTTPPFARVGMTEDEARDAGFNVKTALLPVDHIIRARILDEPTGVLKAVVDANSSQILGMHLFCINAPEMANLAKIAMDARLPYTTLRDAIYTHPTMAESLNNLFAEI